MKLKIDDLLLEDKNVGYTIVSRILKPTLSFIQECSDNPVTITYRKLGQELGGIIGTKIVWITAKLVGLSWQK